ncbi:MAG: hypothetical protein CSA75_01675 [Sorangium cellulosum]|nr:MAG: hypothetical protein CSA75_01675 [Sorangium cellulosum]
MACVDQAACHCHNHCVTASTKPWSSQRLFVELFAPLYPPDALVQLDALRSAHVELCEEENLLARIDEIADCFQHLAPEALSLPSDTFDNSDASVHKLGAVLTRQKRDRLLSENTPGMPNMPLLTTLIIHGTIYVGRCAVRNHGGKWMIRVPLWESSVRLETQIGTCDLALLSWWLKSLSDEEVDRLALALRYRQHVEVPCFDSSQLPLIQGATHPIPRIAFPAYVQLFEHLEAHAPAIRGPGDDFPSPERFAEFKLEWVDFAWLGEGRMLLMHGPGQHGGTHLFWMNEDGFVKSAYYPTDRIPQHMVQVNGDLLRVVASIGGKTRRHEMPWWGV